jgi:site-specific DNA recombinase
MDAVSQLEMKDDEEVPFEKKVAIYLRVSTVEQELEGYSLESQLKYSLIYIEKMNWKYNKNLVFQDEKPASQAINHKIDKFNMIESFSSRPELSKLLLRAQAREFKHLIVYCRDRLSRAIEDTVALELFFQRYGVEVHYIKDGEDFGNTNPKIKRLLHLIFSSLAEMEISLLSSRIKEGGKAAVSKLRWCGGKVPLGYLPVSYIDDTRSKKKNYTKLQISDFESKLVKRIFEHYTLGMGYRRIAEVMQKEFGFRKWTKSAIEKIIKNQTYTGQIAWDRRGGRRNPKLHKYPPILSHFDKSIEIFKRDNWSSICNERENRNRHRDAYYYDTEYILKGKLFCPDCGMLMKPKNPGINKSSIYRCTNTEKVKDGDKDKLLCGLTIPCKVIEDVFIEYMKSEVFQIHDTGRFWDKYSSEFDKRTSEYKDMLNEVTNRKYENESTLEKISHQLSAEKDEEIIMALELQKSIYGNLLNKYKKTEDMLGARVQVNKNTREELDKIVRMFIPGIFAQINSPDITRIRREFIIHFVDNISFSYNKQTRKAFINEVTFMTPEFK